MRKLCAILAADVVGYSAQLRADERATLDALHRLRGEVFGPVFADHSGRILKAMGDGWLVAFDSAANAVNAALQVQDRLTDPDGLRLRIGLHLGDVTETEHDIYGDGINIAARLEAEAAEGGILISDAVYASLDGTLAPSFEAAGARRLKNIDREVLTWARIPTGQATRPSAPASPHGLPRLNIFPTATTDTRPEIEDIAHSITSDLDIRFNGVPWLISKVRAVSEIGAYALETRLRTRGPRLRLETRLMAPNGGTVWAHKSETTLEDSFDWQDAAVDEVALMATQQVFDAENHALRAIGEDALTAEHWHLKGLMAWQTFSLDAFGEALRCQDRAITLRPDFADAYAHALIILVAGRNLASSDALEHFAKKRPDWLEAARPLASGHASLTYAVAMITYLEDKRLAPLNRALDQVMRLAPFDAQNLSYCGWAYLWSGQTQQAYDCFLKSLRTGMQGLFAVSCCGGAATAAVQLGMDDAALELCARGLAMSDDYPTLYAVQAAVYALQGHQQEAEQAMDRMLALDPGRSLRQWRRVNDYGEAPGKDRYFDALVRAGLPLE